MASMDALPGDPAGELAAAEVARRRLTGGLRLPSWFHTSLALATTVQIGTAAYGSSQQTWPAMLVLVAGCLVFTAVAVVQVRRFRHLNGVKVDGLVSRAVLGTSGLSSLAYAGGLATAVWAAFADRPSWAVAAAVVGGAGYAASAHLWWRGYQADPVGHARAESRATLIGYGLLAVAGLVVLVAMH